VLSHELKTYINQEERQESNREIVLNTYNNIKYERRQLNVKTSSVVAVFEKCVSITKVNNIAKLFQLGVCGAT